MATIARLGSQPGRADSGLQPGGSTVGRSGSRRAAGWGPADPVHL